MKHKIILPLIFILLSFSSFSQSLTGKSEEQLKTMQKDAVANENYDLAEKIKKQLERVEANKDKIKKLEEEKKAAILIEDYDKVIELDKQIDALKNGSVKKDEPAIKTTTPITPNPIVAPVAPVHVVQQPVSQNYSATKFFKNGFYMDGYLGHASAGDFGGVGVAFALGNKWYFGSSESHKMGFQVRWGRFGIYAGDDIFLQIAPVNIGFINLFKFSESSGMEANFNLGYSLYVVGEDGDLTGGMVFNPEVKYRYKKLSLGLDYLISSYSYEEQYTTQTSYVDSWGFIQYQTDYNYRSVSSSIGIISVSLGLKF